MITALSGVWVLPAACAMDLVLGDPHRMPHPVRWMGSAISWSEPRFRALSLDLRLSGALMTGGLVAGSWAVAAAALAAARGVDPTVAALLEVLILYFCISTRSLASEAEGIHRALFSGPLNRARKQLGRIVGRDTENLSREQIARAAVETVAENLVDGVVAPLFFAAIGGAPLAAAYRMVNTLDAMIGYRNERYRRFGAFAARLDDVANWLPARISVGLIAAASQLLSGRSRQAMRTAMREGNHHTSPNAGFPEAAFAGALAVRLGGPSRYGGEMVDKPFLGENYGPVLAGDILRARDLMVLSSLLALVAMALLFLLLHHLL
ncbi:MAG: adenosylcobinamide-phosphate synthase CbiB [Desulfobacterales bacterium]|nr:adenosylcobinamide-phosphate synthase CbiB [Desulfobacterales bacterium]